MFTLKSCNVSFKITERLLKLKIKTYKKDLVFWLVMSLKSVQRFLGKVFKVIETGSYTEFSVLIE